MCGIAGIVTFDDQPVERELVGAMCAAMIHRGPDDEGIHVAPGVGLGMRRLSIIDLAGGHQPVANEDRTVWAVLNGEIYNYGELRAQLLARGHVLASESDTETIVHLYEEYGLDFVDHLRGMFAIALWDTRARRVVLARDRLGIKPLYYAWLGDKLVFGSELKALLALPELERRVDGGALAHLLAFLTTPAEQSILAGVRKLPPAHRLVASAHERRVERYWDVHFEPGAPAREDDLVDELRAKLDEAVRLHMVSDVPIGAFLSGGVDSSAVVAMMARASSRPVKTFSIGFREQDFDELRYARQVARAFGTDHHEEIVEPDVLPSLEDLVWHLDEPFGDSSAIPTYVVSRLARREVTVVLSGDGGDELFGGYDRYLVEQRERRLDWLPGVARSFVGMVGDALPAGTRGKNFLRHRALAGPARYLAAQTLFARDERARLLAPDLAAGLELDAPERAAAAYLSRAGDWLSGTQDLDLHAYLPLDILTKVDRTSMACSLEARVPLLDHELVELAARIPAELRLHGTTTKYLFKRALRGILPDTIIDRRKQGFAVPLGRWFRGRLHEVARDVLLGERARTRGLLDPAAVRDVLDAPARGRDLDLQTWTLLSLELWCRVVLDAGSVA